MGEGAAASAIDRLPWLDDEPRAVRRPIPRWLPWTALALLPVAALSYWLGVETAAPPAPERAASSAEPLAPVATMPLPQAREPAPPPVASADAPVDRPRLAPPPRSESPPVRKGRAQTRRAPPPARAATPRPVTGPAAKAPETPQYWPALTSSGAAGRMVRIGVFASRAQAKRGWAKVMKIYPGMTRIPTAVVPVQSMRDGRTYYRLQMGTTSQAHSEVLCQRMRVIGQSCVVVGLIELK